MAIETIDVFCPGCNILVGARVRAEVSGGFRTDALSDIDLPDFEYHGEHYILALCSRCNGPFLVRQSLFGIPGEFETVKQERALYPSADRLDLDNLPSVVHKAFDQARRAFGAALYEPAALMCRKSLEATCKLKGARGGTLFDRLTELERMTIIDARLLAWAHEIRVVANDAAHDPDGEITKDDSRDAIDFTEAILLYVFSLTSRFEQFRLRRARNAPDPPSTAR